MLSYRLGIDTGGTFTDVALINENTGKIFVTKVPSSPKLPSEAIEQGIKKITEENNIEPSEINFFIHGTTVATNALLEYKGAKMALLTTEGFRDILEIGRQTRPKLYDFNARKAEPIVSRQWRLEILERTRFNGVIQQSIDTIQIRRLARYLKEAEIEAVAICLLNSYINREHEQIIKNIMKKEYPEIYISMSAEVLPEYREYERTSTTAINAYVMPKMRSYISRLEKLLKENEVKSELYIMQSNGGIIQGDSAMEVPARTVLSGPAGGALAGKMIAKMTKRKNMITIDMGGTSLDTCLIENEEPHFTTMSTIGSMPIKLPMVEMNTIGSGGGSIARVDTGGALIVGPESAGAYPGPVCYGRGGKEPTVTDANVVLGRLNPKYILGGDMEMNVSSALEAIQEKIAIPLKLTVEEAAEGILRVVNANMVRGIHVVSMEKGHDPRDFPLVAFGGAGPVNAVDIGMELQSPEIIVPKHPGINCAIGMLTADVKHDFVQTYLADIEAVSLEKVNNIYKGLKNEATKQLVREKISEEQMYLQKSLDLRFKGQSYEISIDLHDDVDSLGQKQLDAALKSFYQIYEKLYGHSNLEGSVELVNIRLVGRGYIEEVSFNGEDIRLGYLMPTPVTYRDVFFKDQFISTPIYDRETLKPGMSLKGPAIMEQMDSTVVIYPFQDVYCDANENLIISLQVKKNNDKEGQQYYEYQN